MSLNELGKIFISHSAADKRFVRRLAKRLEDKGYPIWLDEKELRAGDPLTEEIASALKVSRVVIVVVSSISTKSKWLRYELNIAAERMIQGECRLIPVIIGNVTLPAEVAGLVYADFRKGFASGLRAVASAVEHEKRTCLAAAPFYARADAVVSKVFGGIGSVSTITEYKSDDWQTVSNPGTSDSNEVDVHYDSVSAYLKPAEPLTHLWLSEFHDFADEINQSLNLVVTDRAVTLDVSRPNVSMPQVSYLERYGGRSVTVFVELRELSEKQWEKLLRFARVILMQFAEGNAPSGVKRVSTLSIKQELKTKGAKHRG